MSDRSLLDSTFAILNVAGLNPRNRGFYANIWGTYMACYSIGSLISLMMEVTLNWQGLQTLDGAGDIGGFIQVSSKILLMLLRYKAFLKLTAKLDKFWPEDVYGEDLQKELVATFNISRKLCTFYRICFILLGVLYGIKPILTGVRELPLLWYKFTDYSVSPIYEICYGIQIPMIVVCICIVMGFDLLIITYVTYILLELRKIKYGFAHLHEIYHGDEAYLEFRKLVHHHNYVLSFITDLRDIYALVFLNQFMSNIFQICMSLFLLNSYGFPPDMRIMTKYSAYLSSFVCQLVFYCAAGNQVTSEALEVSDSLFKTTSWIDAPSTVRKGMVQVIQRANKPATLSAGGMFDINLESLTSVLKSAFSFFTLLKAVYKN